MNMLTPAKGNMAQLTMTSFLKFYETQIISHIQYLLEALKQQSQY